MERLIDNELIYGGLYRVREPYLVERYNRALEMFGLDSTKLKDFVVDATGYSPQVADDLDDPDYMDPNKVNRRFIILSPLQATAPVIDSSFSSTVDLMQTFFRENEEALKVLTLKDVVLGDIEDSTYRVDSIDDILSIHQVEFRVRTGTELLQKAARIKVLVNRFYAVEDSWKDAALLEEILELAKLTGDVRFNNIVPRTTRFDLKSFWTRHFGGLYVFHDDVNKAVVIGEPDEPAFDGDSPALDRYISLNDPDQVFQYLFDTGRVAGVEPGWLNRSGMVDRRLRILVRTAIAHSEPAADLTTLSDVWIRNWVHRNFDALSKNGLFPFLTRIKKALMNRTTPPVRNTSLALVLQIMRASPAHADCVLVNRLLSEFSKYDFVQRYAVNKEGFYADYKGYPENMKEYAVQVIKTDYFSDRQGYWDILLEGAEG